MDWEIIVEILKGIDIVQLIAIGLMFKYFYNRLDAKIEKLDQKLSNKIDGLEVRIEKVSERVDNIDKRLCRIEGGLAVQGYCIFSHEHKEKKVD